MDFPLDLTIAIPVKNEEVNLFRCLSAIDKGLAKEIVVIDSGSTDGTVAIAKAFGATVVNFVWDGRFPKKRNWLLRNHPFRSRWILFLDADEFLTEAFKEEIAKKTAFSDSDIVGYWLRYSIFFMDKKLKGGYGLHKLALFKIGSGEYEKIDEKRWSGLDMEIHEHPIISGKTGKFKSAIDHRDYRGIDHYLQKHNDYAEWEANRYMNDAQGDTRAHWTLKQKIKYWLMASPFLGPLFFLGSFVLLGGFRNGTKGFVFCTFKMAYFLNIHCRIQELRQKRPV